MMALPQVQRVTHFNNWVVGHAHLGVLAFAGMTALGGLYYVLPKISGKPLYSHFLADLQYWLVLIGSGGFTVVLTIVGLIQGNAWLNGETVYRVLPAIQIYYVLRVAIGFLILSGAYIGLYNIVRTIFFNPGAKA
jgi:cytochrome c oxidase cbb3-type subunit 1/cytochrome c oxidase cbb3-type subunit I/II